MKVKGYFRFWHGPYHLVLDRRPSYNATVMDDFPNPFKEQHDGQTSYQE